MTDAQAKIAQIEERRALRKAELSTAKTEQYALDLEALDALEQEHGDGCVARLDVDGYVKGQPTFVVLRAPSGIQYKRFCDMVATSVKRGDAKARREAENMLAESCWSYPTGEAKKDMLEAFPGLLLSIAIRAVQLVEAKEAEEGKG